MVLCLMSMKQITLYKAGAIKRIRDAINARGWSIAEAERSAGVPKDTIVKMLKGAGTDYEKYIAITKTLGYSVPLYGKLIAGLGVVELSHQQEIECVSTHAGLEYSDDLLAIRVDDDRYEPRYFRGTILYFVRSNRKPVLNSKHPYVISVGGRVDVMLVRPGTKSGVYNLIAIDGSANIIVDAALDWCSKIEGTAWEYN